jgi:hypothetical protein
MTSNKRRSSSQSSSRGSKQSHRTTTSKHERVRGAADYPRHFANLPFFPNSHQLPDMELAGVKANDLLASPNCLESTIKYFRNLKIDETHWKCSAAATDLAAWSIALQSFSRDDIAKYCKRTKITVRIANEYLGGVKFDDNEQRLYALYLARDATKDIADDVNCTVYIHRGDDDDELMTVSRVGCPDALLYYDAMSDIIDAAITHNDALCKVGKSFLGNLHLRPYQQNTYKSHADDGTPIYEGGSVRNLLHLVTKPGLSSAIEGFGALLLRWTHVGLNERMERWEGSMNDNASAQTPQAFYFRTPNSNSIGKNIERFFEKYKKKNQPNAPGQRRRHTSKRPTRISVFQLTNCFDIDCPGIFQSEILKFSPITKPTQRQNDLDVCLSHLSFPTSLILFSGKGLPVSRGSLVELCASINALIEEYDELSMNRFEPEEFSPDHESGLSEVHLDCSLVAWMVLTPGKASSSGGTVCETFFGYAIAIRLLQTHIITRQMINDNFLLQRISLFIHYQRACYNDPDNNDHQMYTMMASPGSFEARVLEHVGVEFDQEIHREEATRKAKEDFVSKIRQNDENNRRANSSGKLFGSVFD